MDPRLTIWSSADGGGSNTRTQTSKAVPENVDRIEARATQTDRFFQFKGERKNRGHEEKDEKPLNADGSVNSSTLGSFLGPPIRKPLNKKTSLPINSV